MSQLLAKYKVAPGTKVDLSKISTDDTGGLTKEQAKVKTQENVATIAALQEMMYAGSDRSAMIALQAMDGGGKDGVTKLLSRAFNLQACAATSFKVPTKEELAHDFLWRVHKVAPAAGHIAILNRSHYEDVLVVRVENIVPEKTWRKNYTHINNFEDLLVDKGTAIAKIFLHISKDEQLGRFKDRIDDPSKNWKLSESDFPTREKWDDYQKAYGDAFTETSTANAPWYIIPADHKWYRDYLVSEIVLDVFKGMNLQPPKSTVDVAALKAEHFPGDTGGKPGKPGKKQPKPGQ